MKKEKEDELDRSSFLDFKTHKIELQKGKKTSRVGTRETLKKRREYRELVVFFFLNYLQGHYTKTENSKRKIWRK